MSSRPPRGFRKLCCGHFDLFGVQNTCYGKNTLRIERDVAFNDRCWVAGAVITVPALCIILSPITRGKIAVQEGQRDKIKARQRKRTHALQKSIFGKF